MKLDLLDLDVLYELERDASIKINSLAKKLRRSKDVISYRITRLQRERILLRCSAIVDMTKLGYFTFRVYIRWQNMTAKEKEQFNEEIAANDHIWTIAVLHGKWDLAFFVGVKSAEFIDAFHETWSKIQLNYKQKIAESKIAIYSPIFNFNKTFFMQKKFNVIERVYGRGPVVPVDSLDEDILRIYAQDVRMPLSRIAKPLHTSIETVRKRIKKLEKLGVIAGFKIDLDLTKLNHQGYRVDFSLNSTARNKELFEYLKQHKYFYQVNQSIGGADFETEIVVENLSHLLTILEEIMQRFEGTINSYDYMGYSLFPKLSVIPD